MPWDELFYSTEWYKSGIACPKRYLPYFQTEANRTVRKLYMKYEKTGIEKWAYGYLTPRFALGSFSREIMWNQCRSLVGYFDNASGASYVHLRFLNEGYDFCSALLHSDQQEEHVLFGLNLFTNGGNTHPVLDKTDGSIVSSDLRIRFEFGGALDGVIAEQTKEDLIQVRMGDLVTDIYLAYGAFEEQEKSAGVKLEWEIERKDGKLYVDYVLYDGPARTFDLCEIGKAAFVFALSVGASASSVDIAVTETPESLEVSGSIADKTLSVSMHVKPCPV
jgi:hypothetical protein